MTDFPSLIKIAISVMLPVPALPPVVSISTIAYMPCPRILFEINKIIPKAAGLFKT
jgi:hypothetical protein